MLIIATYLIPTIPGIPYTPGSGFYTPYWLIFVIILFPRLLFSKGFLIGYLFLIMHLLYVALDLLPPERNNTRLMIDEVLPILFSFSLLEYFSIRNRFNDFRRITNLIFFGTLLTSITSSLSLSIFPDAARALAGSIRDDAALSSFYNLIGIGGFYFYIYLAILTPIPILVILRTKSKKIKFLVLIIYVITFITVLRSQYTASIILFILSSVAAYTYLKTKSIPAYFILITITILLYMNKEFVSNGIKYFAEVVNSDNVTPRLKNIAYIIDGEGASLSDKELQYGAIYADLKTISLNSFNENIFTGGGDIGDHVFWYDVLGNYGLIGLLPWLMFFFYTLKSRRKLFSHEFKGIFYIIFLSLIFIGFHKPLRSFQIIPYITFIIPAVLLKVQNWMTNDKTFIKS
jgi:hypothetical protein